ncbi:MAG TPA: Hsp20/alpha crystallin family protein [Anaerolineales bacterium]|nr:Hsp20/alpha crystallin family protein [Anaerolineales bacterium]
MTTVIRRSETVTLTDKRREVLHAVGWRVSSSGWSPPTDAYETENEYVVRVELAGMRESDFEVVFEDGLLLITGIRPDVAERRAYHQMEIRFGKFSTAVMIPGPVDLDQSKAEYRDGFLSVKLPKAKATDVKIKG